ncbi:WD domain-containing protein [Rhizodiscina lignyota]|uniref:WD domain-containing protein n=1 Tax=Rhizodiscina lignyota TaxID=1504668 RepID=A0A9P4M3V6_9PEZI|nr:WD domain-containing protein [Rhizodiscina lignyota]
MDSGRSVKRQRVNGGPEATPVKRTTSKLFAPFRTVGLVSPTTVPFTSVPLGKTSFQLTTSVGGSLQTYDVRRGLNLVFITRPQTPTTITATASWKDKVIAAFGDSRSNTQSGVWIFKRGKKVDELPLPEDFQDDIKRIIVFGTWIAACCLNRIEVWNAFTLEHHTTIYNSKPTRSGQLPSFTGVISTVPTYINKVFVGRRDGSVQIWNVSTSKLIHTLEPPSKSIGAVTALEAAPALSLLAIAYASGPVVIRDIRADSPILTIMAGSEKYPVTSITFRTDGLGAGHDGREEGVMATASTEAGDISIWDLNQGGRKMGVLYGAHNPPLPSLTDGQKAAGGISKIEFLAGQHIIASSGLDNSLKTWIFDATPFSPVPRILHSRAGHAAPVSTLEFLPSDFDGAEAGGKWILSASNDRSFWGWSLRRDGQSTELSQGASRKKAKKMGLLSHATLHERDKGMSLEDLKVPRITCMACSMNRDGGMGAMPGEKSIWTSGKGSKSKGSNSTEKSATTGWESVITGHEGDKFARTWFWGRKRAGRWAFETGDGANVTAVAMSPCGTFALVGSASGGVDMFNLQSGIHRRRFPPRLTPAQAKRLKLLQLQPHSEASTSDSPKFHQGQGKHTRPVTGIVVDNLNRTVISCSLDGKIKFWDFSSGSLTYELDWSPMTTITGLRFHRSSDLLALSCSDACIRIIDIATKKLVRELWGCETAIADFLFSNDGRWMVAASSEMAESSRKGSAISKAPRSTVRIWDLPTAHLIDAFQLRGQCTALAFSNTGEYLATSSSDSVGIDIWTNRTLFTHVPTRRIAAEDVADLVQLPSASGEGGSTLIASAITESNSDVNGAPNDELGEGDDDDVAALPEIDQLSKDLVTLSLVPKAQWQTLRNLDLVRERNKPKEPPKAPEKAPFFLPSIQDSSASKRDASSKELVASSGTADKQSNELSRLSKSTAIGRTADRDTFTSLLHTASTSASTEHYARLTKYLAALPPSAADLAIRSLDPAPPYTELVTFLNAITTRVRERRDFELVNVWVGVWVKCHGSLLLSGEEDGLDEVREALQLWREEARLETERLEGLVGLVGGVLGWVGGV